VRRPLTHRHPLTPPPSFAASRLRVSLFPPGEGLVICLIRRCGDVEIFSRSESPAVSHSFSRPYSLAPTPYSLTPRPSPLFPHPSPLTPNLSPLLPPLTEA
jgi:hypothetical protein